MSDKDPQVFDLDSAVTVEEVEPFRFSFGGEEFTLISPNTVDVRELGEMQAEAERNPSALLEWLLGDEEQWKRLDAIEATFTGAHLMALQEQWLTHYGLDMGKLPGSPKPSRAIRRR